MSKHHFSGEKGNNGSSQEKHGRNGKNYVLRVPCGVVVRRILEWNERWDEKEGRVMMIDGNDNRDDYYDDDDYYTDEDSQDVEEEGLPSEDFEAGSNVENQKEDVDWGEEDDGIRERYNIVLADLNVAGSFVEVAHGGRGGTGNCTVRGRDKNDSKYAQKAGLRARSNPGEMSFLELELKLIADLGFVGFPNAGKVSKYHIDISNYVNNVWMLNRLNYHHFLITKSSLLASMSRASPEIAPYPFTTLQPLVGTIEYRDGFRVLAADVPGLVKGASSGRGRGFDFLRHLERTKALLYMVDAAGVDGRCPVEDLKILFNEIAEFGDGDMLKRPSLVVANKLDLLREEDGNNILLELGIALEEAGLQCKDVIGISALSGHGLSHLSKEMRAVVEAGEYSRVISE